MASNLRRSKRTVGKRINEVENKVARLRRVQVPSSIRNNVITNDNLSDITASRITTGTLEGITITGNTIIGNTITGNTITGGTITGTTIRAGSPDIYGNYPFSVSQSGTVYSISGKIGGFTLSETYIRSDYGYVSGGGNGTASLQLDSNGRVYSKVVFAPLIGSSWYKELYLNKWDTNNAIYMFGTGNYYDQDTTIDPGYLSIKGNIPGTGLVETWISNNEIHTGRIYTGSGSAATPAYNFDTDTNNNTGMYRPAENQIGFTVGGTNKLTITSTSLSTSNDIGCAAISCGTVTSTGYFRASTGAAGSPSFSFSGDANTGIYRTSAGVIAFASNGTQVARIGASALDISDGGLTLIAGADVIAEGSSGVLRCGSSNTSTFSRFGTGATTAGAFRTQNATNVFGQSLSGTTTVLYINNNGTLGTVTSSIRYKEDIKDLSVNYKDVLKIEPVTFLYKEGLGDPEDVRTQQVGVIAEQVEEIGGLHDLLVYNDDVLETFKYDKLSIYLLKVCQEQENLIENLMARVSELESKL